MESIKELGIIIKAHRIKKNINRNQAKIIGRFGNPTPIIDIEEGRVNYTIKRLFRILNILDITLAVVEKSTSNCQVLGVKDPKDLGAIIKHYRVEKNISRNRVKIHGGFKTVTPIIDIEDARSNYRINGLFRVLNTIDMTIKIVPIETNDQ